MNELKFSLDEIKDFIEKEIPDFEKPELLELLSAPDGDEASLDAIGEKFLNAAFIQSDDTSIQGVFGEMSFKKGISISRTDWQENLLKMKEKAYWFLCTEGHKEHFDTAKAVIKELVNIILGIPTIGIPAKIVSVIATAIVISVVKKGIHNWCEDNKCVFNKG